MSAERDELKAQVREFRELRDEYNDRLVQATRDVGRALLDGDEGALARARTEKRRMAEAVSDIYAVLPILEGRIRELGG